MRVWLDRRAIAARGLTVGDIERAVRAENVETPAGSLTSQDLIFTNRIERPFRTPEEFAQLVVAKGEDGVAVRLGDVARVEFGAEEDRNIFRGNGRDTIGIGIVKQSTANVVEVAADARERTERSRIDPARRHQSRGELRRIGVRRTPRSARCSSPSASPSPSSSA